MLIGAMNHPAIDILSEIEWMAELQLGFIDLTLEPPEAAAWNVQPAAIRRALRDHGMKVVGHTAYYLPFASAFESLRRGSRRGTEALPRCLCGGGRSLDESPSRSPRSDARPHFLYR